MAYTILKLKQKLEKFKAWIREPRLYIMEELDTIKNQIDIFAENFLLKLYTSQEKSPTQKATDIDKINTNRKHMIAEVEAYEKKIFAKLTTNELDAELVKRLALSIENHLQKLDELDKKQQTTENLSEAASSDDYSSDDEWREEDISDELSALKQDIARSIYEFDCEIKQNSSLLFLNVFLLKHSLIFIKRKQNSSEVRVVFPKYYNSTGGRAPLKTTEKHFNNGLKYTDGPDADEFHHEYYQVQCDDTTFGVLFVLNDCICKEDYM